MEEKFQNEKLKALRLEKGMTIDQVAYRIKAGKATVSRWETGQNAPRPRHLKALTKMFGVTRAFFFTADEAVAQ